MRSKTVAQLLADLSDHAKPHAALHLQRQSVLRGQFRTLKYRPEFPDRFGSHEHGLGVLRPFFHWYNEQHHHGGIGFFTPGQVHRGETDPAFARRERALAAAFRAHPERFKGRRPAPPAPPSAVWINPPALDRNGDPSPRSRQNVQIGPVQGKNDAPGSPRIDATDRAVGMSTPKTEHDEVDDQLIVTSARH